MQPACRRPAPRAGRYKALHADPLCCAAWARATFARAALLSAIGCVWRDAVPAATTKSVAQAHGNAGLDELSENRKAYSETTHARL